MGGTVVLGGSGLVGSSIARRLGALATSHTPREGFEPVDATRPDELRAFLTARAPSTVVNCVGLADVDRAEREPAAADALNRGVVEHLARLQDDLGYRLVHISSDYVFDGRTGAYREEDPASPINEYGRSKHRGETVLTGRDRCLVLRISSPYGRTPVGRKPQFFQYAAESLAAGRPVRALTDQRVTATYLPDLARAVEHLVERDGSGLLHIGSAEPMTRYEFARAIAETVHADPALVEPATRSEMTQWVAPRPADTSLEVSRSVAAGVVYTRVRDACRSLCAPGGRAARSPAEPSSS